MNPQNGDWADERLHLLQKAYMKSNGDDYKISKNWIRNNIGSPNIL